MAFQSKDGKKNNSKFRMNRRDRENAVEDGMEKAPAPKKGLRAQANEIEAKGKKDGGYEQEEQAEEQISPGIHQKVARELHVTHDDASGMHHVHAVHDDGTEEHSDHPSRAEAHFHAAHVAGAADMSDGEGNYPEKHEPPTDESEDNSYDVEPL